MNRSLEVWLLGSHLGTLSQVDGRLSFSYAEDGLLTPANSAALPQTMLLSQSLPVGNQPFDDRATRPFFAGLLPEGNKRRLVAQALHVSRQNEFALLDSLGGECAGAVTLLHPGETPPAPDAAQEVRWLDDAQLLRLLDEMPLRPMLAGDEGLRLSLAGAQDKLPVVADIKLSPESTDVGITRIGLPLFGAPSTHILKPPIASVDSSVYNEGFCMALAAALKLAVAKAKIHQIADQQGQNFRQYLLVERYDRYHDAASHESTQQDRRPIQRLHQEDACQALGCVSELKYQNEGGPGLAQLFALLRSATRPSAPHVLKLLDFVVFNTLIGNHDAHGKNFSLLYTSKGAVLAPLYDALCTAVYPTLTEKMAMKIGSKYKFSEVQGRHWGQFAVEAGLSPALVKKRILDIARQLPSLASVTLSAFEVQGNGHAILGQIVNLINQRCALTIRRLTTTSEDMVDDEPDIKAP